MKLTCLLPKRESAEDRLRRLKKYLHLRKYPLFRIILMTIWLVTTGLYMVSIPRMACHCWQETLILVIRFLLIGT